MTKLITLIFTISVCAQIGFAQTKQGLRNSLRQAQKEAREIKKEAANISSLVPADFNDTASFGKTVKFLGSLYAGTLYVFRSCDPQVLLDELGLVLAPDDHCVVHNLTSPMPRTTVFDPVWQITIPGNTVDNVIYPMLNNTIGFDATPSAGPTDNGYGPGFASIQFSPVVTIESIALNDPEAVDPTSGAPLNGFYTAVLAGTRVKGFVVGADDFFSENDSYATVSGRGRSRTYFDSLGFPQSVINNLFK